MVLLFVCVCGDFSDEAFKLLQSRYLWNENSKLTIDVDVTCVYEYNVLVNEHNYIAPHLYARKKNVKLYRITSETTDRAGNQLNPDVLSVLFQKPKLESDIAKGILPHFDFWENMSVCVYQGIRNGAVKTAGLGNGTITKIVGVLPLNALDDCTEEEIERPARIRNTNQKSKVLIPKSYITHLLLRLPLSSPKSFRFRGLPWNVYPLPRKKVRSPKSKFQHLQFPVRGVSAVTSYKVQGRTLPKVASAVNVVENHLYVVLSRVRWINDFYLLHPFTKDCMKKCGPGPSVKKVMQRLRKLQKTTI